MKDLTLDLARRSPFWIQSDFHIPRKAFLISLFIFRDSHSNFLYQKGGGGREGRGGRGEEGGERRGRGRRGREREEGERGRDGGRIPNSQYFKVINKMLWWDSILPLKFLFQLL